MPREPRTRSPHWEFGLPTRRAGRREIADGVQIVVVVEGAEEACGQVLGHSAAGAGHLPGSAAMLRRESCSALTSPSLS
jgi:hypothetical protein